MKKLLNRFWTWIMSKISVIKYDIERDVIRSLPNAKNYIILNYYDIKLLSFTFYQIWTKINKDFSLHSLATSLTKRLFDLKNERIKSMKSMKMSTRTLKSLTRCWTHCPLKVKTTKFCNFFYMLTSYVKVVRF